MSGAELARQLGTSEWHGRRLLARHSIGQVLLAGGLGWAAWERPRWSRSVFGLWEASGCPHARTLMGWHARSGRNSPHPRSGGRSEGPAPS
jgi:hypothetical protein